VNLKTIDFVTRFAGSGQVWNFYVCLLFKKRPGLMQMHEKLIDGSFVTIYRHAHIPFAHPPIEPRKWHFQMFIDGLKDNETHPSR
jgi:hypothetical protein